MRLRIVVGWSVPVLALAIPACRVDVSGLVEVDGGQKQAVGSTPGKVDALSRESGVMFAGGSAEIAAPGTQPIAAQWFHADAGEGNSVSSGTPDNESDAAPNEGAAPVVTDPGIVPGLVNMDGGTMGRDGPPDTGGEVGGENSPDGGGVDGWGQEAQEPCTPTATPLGGQPFVLNTTGAVCLRRKDDIDGWNCSNLAGRTVRVNNVTMACGDIPLPPKWNGYYYFDVSAGLYTFASITWW